MSSHEGGVTRRTLVNGMAVAAGVMLAPAAVSAKVGGGPTTASSRAVPLQVPALTSTALAFTHLPAAAFRASSSAAVWAASSATLAASSPGPFFAPLTPSVNDLFRELDVYIEPGGQSGAITISRHRPLAPAAVEVLGSAAYPAAGGLQTVVVHLDHRADPMTWNYVVTVELKPGVVLHGASLWYFPLEAGFVQLPPQRAYDSRAGDSKTTSGEVRTISLEPVLTQVPGSALINLTIDQTEGSGYLSVFSPVGEGGSPPPGTSNINWSTNGQTLANLAVVKLVGEHSDSFAVLSGGAGRTHFIVDVLGYFI